MNTHEVLKVLIGLGVGFYMGHEIKRPFWFVLLIAALTTDFIFRMLGWAN